MQFEAIANRIIEEKQLEYELIYEAGPLAFVLGAGAAVAAGNIIKKYFGGNLPDWMENMSKEWWWAGLSLFDPTGVMSQPYLQEAWRDVERKPDDQWANIKWVLAFLATIPGTQIKFTSILKLLTGAPILRRVITYFFSGVGKAINKTPVTEKIMPLWVAKSSGQMYNGVDQATVMRNAFEKSFGIKLSDEAIEKIAKENGIKLKTPGLISKTATAIGQGAAKTGAAAGKLGIGALKLAGKGGTLATGLGALGSSIFDKRAGSLGGQRTAPVMGPKVQFGYIGGVVK